MQAIDDYNTVLLEDPTDWVSLLRRGMAWIEEGSVDGAGSGAFPDPCTLQKCPSKVHLDPLYRGMQDLAQFLEHSTGGCDDTKETCTSIKQHHVILALEYVPMFFFVVLSTVLLRGGLS